MQKIFGSEMNVLWFTYGSAMNDCGNDTSTGRSRTQCSYGQHRMPGQERSARKGRLDDCWIDNQTRCFDDWVDYQVGRFYGDIAVN